MTMPPLDQAANVSNVVARGARNASEMSPESSAFDIWSHSVDGLSQSMQDFADDPVGTIQNRAEQEARMREAMGPENWQSSEGQQAMDSMGTQLDGLGEQLSALGEGTVENPDGTRRPKTTLEYIGQGFQLLTGFEQCLSTALSVIPFPAFPAIRVMDMDVGLPHGHGHPPNIPPPPPIPLPSTGPIIPIPIFSGAAQTLINGMPAARCGDMGLGIWCGGYFPMYEVFLGSSNVWIEGARAGRVLCDITKHCIFTTPKPSDFPLYTFLGMTISSSSNVMIGGVPMPSLLSLGMGAAFRGLFSVLGKAARGFGRVASRLGKRIGSKMDDGFIKCKIFRAEPVSVVTGEVVVDQQDFSIPGRIPIEWNRHYGSQSDRIGVCGYGWETPADARLEFYEEGYIRFCDGTGIATYFETLPVDGPVLEPVNGGTLHRVGLYYAVRLKEGLTYYFPIPKQPVDEVLVEHVVDLCKNHLRYVRDENGLVRIEESAGRQIEVKSVNGLVQIMRLRHPDYKDSHPLVRFEYGGTGDLVCAYDALNAPYQFRYKTHRLTQHTDRNGLSFYYDYENYSSSGRCVHTWGDGGLYDYHLRFNPLKGETQVTDSLGNISTIEYNEVFQVIREVDPLNGVTLYEYDDVGRTSAVVDPACRRTEYYYDARGNLLKLVRPDSTSIINDYSNNNVLTSTIDPNKKLWRFENEDGLLKKRATPRGAEWHDEYDSHGDLVATTNPIDAKTVFLCDRYGNLVEVTDSRSHTSHFVYDIMGNMTVSVDPLAQKTSYLYDAKNRLLRVTNPSGNHIRMDYDPEDNLIKHKDENGHVTHLKYMGLGQLTERVKPDGSKVHYHYNTEEQLTTVINERGEKYQMTRDPLGRVTWTNDYWGSTTEYEFDSVGRIVKTQDSIGRISRSVYDLLGRLTEIIDNEGKREKFAYDANGNVVLADNETITIRREYDDDGNMVLEQQGEFRVVSKFDLVGRRTTRASDHGNILNITYDTASNITEIALNGQPLLRSRYDKNNRVCNETVGHRLKRNMTYDEDGNLVYQQLGQIADRHYEYDNVGNLARRIDANKGTTALNYDPLGQVFEQIGTLAPSYKLDYDAAGDLRRGEHNHESTGSIRVEEYDGIKYEFDPIGNLIRRETGEGKSMFVWDGNSRLVSAINELCQNVEYQYDAFGRRVYKSVDGVITQFCWDGDVILSDRELTEGPREFVFREGTFEPLAFVTDKTFFFENDQNGLPHEVVDIQGQLAWSASYEPLGRIEHYYVESRHNPIRLRGQYFDEETGLSYNGARYYDPQCGSFVSPDPLGVNAGPNLYRYAPNVWAWADPYGLSCYFVRVRPGWRGGPDPHWAIDTSRFSMATSRTARGFPRNAQEFWEAWARQRPGSLSDTNLSLMSGRHPATGRPMRNRAAPRVDDEWIRQFPEHAPHRGERLVHHHVDGGRWAIPVPEGSHRGSGGPWHGQP